MSLLVARQQLTGLHKLPVVRLVVVALVVSVVSVVASVVSVVLVISLVTLVSVVYLVVSVVWAEYLVIPVYDRESKDIMSLIRGMRCGFKERRPREVQMARYT